MEAKGIYTTAAIFIWFDIPCIQKKRNELHLTVLEDTIPIGVDKKERATQVCPGRLPAETNTAMGQSL